MTPTEPKSEPRAPSATPNVIDIVEALQRSLMIGSGGADDFRADMEEAELILQRLHRDLAVEEALTHQLMVRQGI